MSRRILALAAGTLVASVVLVTFTVAVFGVSLVQPTAPSSAASHEAQQAVSNRNATAYGSLRELKEGATLVAVGAVSAVRHNASDAHFGGAPASYFTFGVERVLKGKAVSRAVVAQVTSDDGEGTNVTTAYDPALAVGEQAVLFLYTSDASYFTLLDGGAGHFTVANGLVQQRRPWPGGAEGAASSTPAVSGVTLDDFITQVLAS